MIQTFKNVISQEEIQELLDYMSVEDDRTDKRPDVTSKHPRWNIDTWPQHIIQKILDKYLDYPYEIDEIIFNQFKISFKLHADSGKSLNQRQGSVIIIPLECNGPSHTVFFDNFWHNNSARFSKVDIDPWSYNLKNKHGEWQTVKHVGEFLDQCLTSPETVTDFILSEEFIDEVKLAVRARENKGMTYADDRCYDYADIENYDAFALFDTELQQKYLSHIPIESLHGLTVDSVIEWVPGEMMLFERTRIHAAASGHTEKKGITIFTSTV